MVWVDQCWGCTIPMLHCWILDRSVLMLLFCLMILFCFDYLIIDFR
ncbi:unnamed protein product [Arabidopsis halleri]